MASPQKEDGYTPIANELLDALMKGKFNGTQWRILTCIFRYTYGFNRKSHKMSNKYMSKATGINEKQINRELLKLVDKKIIILYSPGDRTNSREIGINKYYNQWIGAFEGIDNLGGSNALKGSNVLNGSDETDGSDKTDTKVPSNQLPKKDNIIKDNIYSQDELEILNFWNSKKIVKHRLTPDLERSIKTALKKFKNKDNIIKAINNYSIVYFDKDYYYSYIWRLDKFLKQSNGVPNFMNDGQQWINYKNRASPPGKSHLQDSNTYKPFKFD